MRGRTAISSEDVGTIGWGSKTPHPTPSGPPSPTRGEGFQLVASRFSPVAFGSELCPAIQPLFHAGFGAFTFRRVESLALHPFREIVLAGEALVLVVVVGI